jgi:hypothetical protein
MWTFEVGRAIAVMDGSEAEVRMMFAESIVQAQLIRLHPEVASFFLRAASASERAYFEERLATALINGTLKSRDIVSFVAVVLPGEVAAPGLSVKSSTAH